MSMKVHLKLYLFEQIVVSGDRRDAKARFKQMVVSGSRFFSFFSHLTWMRVNGCRRRLMVVGRGDGRCFMVFTIMYMKLMGL